MREVFCFGHIFASKLKLQFLISVFHISIYFSTGNNLTNLASSVENLRSLSRLFPHLSKELSNSLPIDFQIDDLVNKSPCDYQEYIQTDLSSTSSLTSSFSRSGMGNSLL